MGQILLNSALIGSVKEDPPLSPRPPKRSSNSVASDVSRMAVIAERVGVIVLAKTDR